MSNVVPFPTKKENPPCEIVEYFHCGKCMDEIPDGMSLREYGYCEMGFTDFGIEMWCKRHDELVAHFNLTDIWKTLSFLKEVRGEEPMPLVRVPPDEVPEILILSGVEGVYIDPIDYWKHSGGFPPDHEFPSTIPAEGAGFTCDGCGKMVCECTE